MNENQYITKQAIEKARALVKECEGLRLNAYYDGGGVLTIGYGHVLKSGEAVQIDLKKAESLLASDMSVAVNTVNDLLVVIPFNSNQQAALVSLIFNIGQRAFEKSTLRKVLLGQAGSGTLQAIRAQWMRWVFDEGRIVNGLVNRREAEFELFTCIRGL